MKVKKYSSRSRVNSFEFAINGIRQFFREEPNARIHLLVTVIVFIASAHLDLRGIEFALLIIVIGLVWVSEIFNTTIEKIMDFISPDYHSKVKTIKDMSAAAVLVSAIIAAITGLIVFIPKII